MPVEYRIALESDLLYARHFGQQTMSGLKRAFEAYLADPDYKLGRPEFIDLSEITLGPFSYLLMRSFAALVNKQFEGGAEGTRTAIWAPDEAVFAAARMFQLAAGAGQGATLRAHVARDEAEAFEAFGASERSVSEFLGAHDFGPVVYVP